MYPSKPPLVSWQSAPQILTLAPGEIHLWQACLEIESVQLDIFYQQLSDDERARSDRFRDRKDRERYIAAHGFLRTILSRYLGTKPDQLTFHRNEYGKPFLCSAGCQDIRFNMSRSGGISLIAVARDHEVGVDIEHVRSMPEYMQVAEHSFCQGECLFLCSLDPEVQLETFFRYWTLKEAFVKARGRGLSIPLDQFEVCFQGEKPILRGASGMDSIDTQDWSLLELNPHPGYAAGLAVEGSMGCISFWRLDHAEKIWDQDR